MQSHTLHLCSYLKYTRLLYSSVFQLLRTKCGNRPGPGSISTTISCFGMQVNRCFDKTHVYTHAHTHANKLTYDLSAITVPQEAHERELALLFDESASRNSELEHKATTLELCNLRLVDDLSALAISQVHERQSICVIYARVLICTYTFLHTRTHACGYIHPHNTPRTMKYMCVRVLPYRYVCISVICY